MTFGNGGEGPLGGGNTGDLIPDKTRQDEKGLDGASIGTPNGSIDHLGDICTEIKNVIKKISQKVYDIVAGGIIDIGIQIYLKPSEEKESFGPGYYGRQLDKESGIKSDGGLVQKRVAEDNRDILQKVGGLMVWGDSVSKKLGVILSLKHIGNIEKKK